MAPPTALSPRNMRRHNLGLVLRTVADRGTVSRAEIVAATALNKSTVSSLVGELLARGLVRENGERPTRGAGRPGRAIGLDGDTFVALGLEVSVDHLSFAAIDLLGRVRDEGFLRRENRGEDPGETIEALGALVSRPLERLRAGGLRPVGVTVGLPGLVDPTRGELIVAPNLRWGRVPVARLLRDHLGGALEVRLENEANLAALAERWESAGRDTPDFVYVSGYAGVGAGLVTGGELYRGGTGFGGELGHMTLAPDGPSCACGSRGCVETFAGLRALLRQSGYSPRDVRLTSPTAPVHPVPEIAAAATNGDARILAALEDIGSRLGIALASSINLIGAPVVVLGGYFTPLHPWLHEPIAREIRHRVLAAHWAPVEVLRSRIIGGAPVRGGAGVLLRALIDDPDR
ncbi:ROK family transcriptional regulator [Egibacter rhizosphaerae]|nr:ROK family transcriptional regulator [Egibacter rhizosphaerae]